MTSQTCGKGLLVWRPEFGNWNVSSSTSSGLKKTAALSSTAPGALVNYSRCLTWTPAKCLDPALLISSMSVSYTALSFTIKHCFFLLKNRPVFLHTTHPSQPNPPLQKPAPAESWGSSCLLITAIFSSPMEFHLIYFLNPNSVEQKHFVTIILPKAK